MKRRSLSQEAGGVIINETTYCLSEKASGAILFIGVLFS
jgi:hypothetical protein